MDMRLATRHESFMDVVDSTDSGNADASNPAVGFGVFSVLRLLATSFNSLTYPCIWDIGKGLAL